MKNKIRDFINRHDGIVQVGITATNNTWQAYLTTSGKVCRREYGFIENLTDDDVEGVTYFTMPLKTNSFVSVCRLQNVLAKLTY